MRYKISGIILVKDNQSTIKQAIESIKDIIDELIIVDDFSTDKTTEIIKNIYPEVKIFQRKLDRFDSQRNFALGKAKNEWVLMIDSDEIVTKELANSIKDILTKTKQEQAYSCFRLNEALDHFVKEKIPRAVFFKKHLRFEGAVHEVIKVKLKYLKGFLIHNSWTNITDWIADLNHYSTHTAKKWIIQKRNYNKLQLFLIGTLMPIYSFLQRFFWQKRFTKGVFAGFLYPLAWSVEWIFIVLKYYEIKYLKKEKKENIKTIKEDV